MRLVPFKGSSRELPYSFHHMNTQLNNTGCELGRWMLPDPADALILNFPASKIARNKFVSIS